MKKNMFLLCLLGAMSLLFSDDEVLDVVQPSNQNAVFERIAVLPFTGGENQEGEVLAQMLGTELTKIGNFQIVPRTAAIEKVMQEHNFQRTGLTDGDTIVELGRGVNARYVVSGHIQNLDKRKMISASIVDVETFQQVSGGYYEYKDLSDVVKYLPKLAQKIVVGTKKDYSNAPILAIVPFDSEDNNNSDVLAQLLAIELANSGKYVVVTRTTTIENVMEELNIQRSGITESSTIAKLGNAVNADYVLSGSAHKLGSKGVLNAQIIDVLSLVQEKGAYIEYESIEDGASLMPKLASELTENMQVLEPITYDSLLKKQNTYKTVKYVGRSVWITGAASLLASGVLSLVSINIEEPMLNSYSNYDEYNSAYSKYLRDGERDLLLLKTLSIAGGAAVLIGGALDVTFSIFENKVLDDMINNGFNLSASPVITQNINSNELQYGVRLSIKYSY